MGISVALRYSAHISRDIRRGYSFGEWGQSPYTARVECEAEWPHHEARYSRELGGWLPAHNGLCAAVVEWGEDFAAALAAALANLPAVEGLEKTADLYAFAAIQIGTDPYGWPLVRPTGRARRVG